MVVMTVGRGQTTSRWVGSGHVSDGIRSELYLYEPCCFFMYEPEARAVVRSWSPCSWEPRDGVNSQTILLLPVSAGLSKRDMYTALIFTSLAPKLRSNIPWGCVPTGSRTRQLRMRA